MKRMWLKPFFSSSKHYWWINMKTSSRISGYFVIFFFLFSYNSITLSKSDETIVEVINSIAEMLITFESFFIYFNMKIKNFTISDPNWVEGNIFRSIASKQSTNTIEGYVFTDFLSILLLTLFLRLVTFNRKRRL